jgi:hypothetical protein
VSAQSKNADIELLKQHAAKLGEMFDSVHIFCTRHEPAMEDGTVTVNWGVGNWYARYGQIIEWTIRSDENSRMAERFDKE